jgi:DNA invertase Pin-like site-specific DNA recombinase
MNGHSRCLSACLKRANTGSDGGFTDRPDLQRLLDDIRARKLDVIVVYKVDRLTKSLADFAKLVELFDAHSVSFVSVTGPKGRALHMSAPGPTSPVRFQHRVHGRDSRNH